MIVYLATNQINNKVYVGQTIRPLRQRINQHFNSALSRNSSTPFHRSIRKFGKENYKFTVLDTALTVGELAEKETFYIEKFKSSVIGIGYNACKRGFSNPMYGKKRPDFAKWCKENRKRGKDSHSFGKKNERLSIMNTVRKKGKNLIEQYGAEKAKSIKEKLSKFFKGRKHPPISESTRKNMSEAAKKRPPMKAYQVLNEKTGEVATARIFCDRYKIDRSLMSKHLNGTIKHKLTSEKLTFIKLK